MNLIIGKNMEKEFIDLLNTIPDEIMKLEGLYDTDPFNIANHYFGSEEGVSDISIDPNANVNGKSPVNFISEMSKPTIKLWSYYIFWLNLKKRWGLEEANEIIKDVFSGLLYIHDISKIFVSYCIAVDTTFLMIEGRPYGWLPSTPPKRLQSFMGQLREMTMDMSQENAGAIGLANALVNMAYYTKREGTSDKAIENEIQQTIHVYHNQFRVGGDSPFTNFSLFDTPTLMTLFADARYPDGSKVTDNIDEIMRVQKIYAKFFVKGSPKTGKPYRFPVTTVNIKTNGNGEIVDKEFFEYMADLNRERCVLNWHIGEKVASCCRMTSSLADLKNQIRMDSFGNGGISVGSHRVVTINLHRVALISKSTDVPFHEVINNALTKAEKLLVVHKKDILQPLIDSGFLKFFRIGWLHPNMFFSTIGFTGLYDGIEALRGGIVWRNPELYWGVAGLILDHMEEFALEAGKRNEGFAFNVEEIPGENASPKLAAKDNFYYDTDLELLSNQMVPLYKDIDFFDRLIISGELMNRVSGGAILHLNIDDELTVGANRELLKRMIEHYRIPHFALNKGFSTCKNGHTTVGVHHSCPECGAEIETHISRVVGFFTDTKDWVKSRREFEFNNRRWYKKEDMVVED